MEGLGKLHSGRASQCPGLWPRSQICERGHQVCIDGIAAREALAAERMTQPGDSDLIWHPATY